LCVPVEVYWCAPGEPVMPASWGQWLIPAGIGSAHEPCFLTAYHHLQAAFGIE
jgi:hypothetical protein